MGIKIRDLICRIAARNCGKSVSITSVGFPHVWRDIFWSLICRPDLAIRRSDIRIFDTFVCNASVGFRHFAHFQYVKNGDHWFPANPPLRPFFYFWDHRFPANPAVRPLFFFLRPVSFFETTCSFFETSCSFSHDVMVIFVVFFYRSTFERSLKYWLHFFDILQYLENGDSETTRKRTKIS